MATKATPDFLPTHIGLILDGNRRWAKARGLPKLEGHRVGYLNLKTIVKAAVKRGIKYVSAYIFSTENWNRSKAEVSYLMDLAYRIATKEVVELDKEDICIKVLGSRKHLSPKLLKVLDEAVSKTANNKRGTLALCFNYGGQQELVEAVRGIIIAELPFGTYDDEFGATVISNHLYAPEVPPIDLIIRTSGEQRISNFMLWRAAYSELIFVNKHWPDFTEADLDAALADYALRQRRFGK